MSTVEEASVEQEGPVSQVVPILPLKETVVFPDSMTPLAIGQERSIQLVEEAVANEREIALVTSRAAEDEPRSAEDIYEVGTAAVIHKMIRVPDGTLRILVQGLRRVRLVRLVQDDPYLVGEFEELPDVIGREKEIEALARNVEALFSRIIGLVPYLPDELQLAAANAEDPSGLANLIASTMRLKTPEKQELLEEADVEERLRKLTVILNRELEVLELGTKIQSQVHSEMEKSQREYFLRQQMKAIQDELGEGDEQQAEIAELRAQIEEAGLPEEADRAARRELDRLAKLPPAAAEYGVIRTYLEWILSLPWTATTVDDLDLEKARTILDEDHYDLEMVKERIVEHLAVSKLKEDLSGPILCFVGPPGVGKTSLGQSIARALGRKFVRISVGGVRDEAEIRGHRRTYIGALPGTIIRALRDVESKNPVFMIDEIDKMGSDWRGDPSSAMLEVLDPAQNSSFRDHYLDLPFDLSRVLFICTANQLETIPPPLLDRMEVIRLSGYTEDEKLGIAKRYLVAKQLEAHGLSAEQIKFTDNALRLIIREYTREAGVRNLEREIATLCRKAAADIAAGKRKRVRVDDRRVRSWLGRPRFAGEVRKRTSDPGVATGLAVTPVGGDVLFIEATAMPGDGKLIVTGQLGEVMRESAQAALSWVRGHAADLGLERDWFEGKDVHIHVPAGAVPKDGPSAGIALATALASLALGRPVSEDVAMTGEITLTGQVLPIGG
ncbi:MAG TPA: endopeptidase La, partial [Gaiellaceae bacterium]